MLTSKGFRVGSTLVMNSCTITGASICPVDDALVPGFEALALFAAFARAFAASCARYGSSISSRSYVGSGFVGCGFVRSWAVVGFVVVNLGGL
jgi:hypothetical protein